MRIFLISILGHYKIGLDLGVISMHSRFFSKGQGTEFGLLKFQRFFLGGWGCLLFLIFWGRTVYAGSKPTYEET